MIGILGRFFRRFWFERVEWHRQLNAGRVIVNGDVWVLVKRFLRGYNKRHFISKLCLVINQGPDMAIASSTNVSTSWGDLSDVSVNLQIRHD